MLSPSLAQKIFPLSCTVFNQDLMECLNPLLTVLVPSVIRSATVTV